VAENRRVAFLGIGHPLRRDDAAGVEVCRRIAPGLAGRDDVLAVDGGPAPENCIGALRAFAPHLVVVVDAARMGQPPGTLLRIDPSDPRLAGASTHTMPLPAFCEYVEATLGCGVTLLGIEPADTSFGEGLTPVVERAVGRAASEAVSQFESSPSASPPHPLSADSLVVIEGSGVGMQRLLARGQLPSRPMASAARRHRSREKERS
jgi:hydrogenase 3 maturation protease